jgi:Aerotolerance regulator N-terminal/von Willebrand factor type A domain
MPSFLSPLFLVGVAAAAIPIAIHLFYRRTEPVIDFAAMRYLRRAPVEHSRRRRLRELVLLALRVTALVLLALAFARPYFSDSVAAEGGAATLVMIDTSVSLSAPGRFEAARERARRAIEDAPATHAVGLVAFAQAADVIAPVSQNRAGAVAALAQVRPGAGATKYRAALQGAADAFNGRSGRIIVVTDLQQSGWDAASDGGIPEGISVEVDDVGAPDTNLAVTSLRVEGADAVAVVQNYSARPATDQVIFAVDARRIGAVPVTVGANASVEARVALDGVAPGGLSGSITDRDGYSADNTRYAILDESADAVSVFAVTPTGHPSEALYLERALAVAEGARGFRFRSMGGGAFAAIDPKALEPVGVIAVLSTRGVAQRGRERLAEFVRGGGGLLVAAGPDVDPAILKDALAGIVETSWGPRAPEPLSFAPDDSRHPVFRVFGGAGTLGNVGFSRAVRITSPAGANVIARYSDGSPALVEERTAGGRVLVFGSDLNYRWNDFPLQPAFVPFIHETVRYLASPRTSRTEYLVGDLQAATTPGVLELQGRRIAVNPDPRESDPTRMTAQTFQAGISRLNAAAARDERTAAQQQEESQFLWWYGLLFMVVSLAAEGVIGRRLG